MNEMSYNTIYSKAKYVPALYFIGVAPALFLFVTIALLGTAGVAQLYPEYFFPTDFSLALAGSSFLLSSLMFLVFQLTIKQLINQEKAENFVVAPQEIETKIGQAFSPIFNQLKEEHNLIKTQIFHEAH